MRIRPDRRRGGRDGRGAIDGGRGGPRRRYVGMVRSASVVFVVASGCIGLVAANDGCCQAGRTRSRSLVGVDAFTGGDQKCLGLLLIFFLLFLFVLLVSSRLLDAVAAIVAGRGVGARHV